jgi:hypothetical protein
MLVCFPARPKRWLRSKSLFKNPEPKRFVTGHDFSRADNADQIKWALAPEECILRTRDFCHRLLKGPLVLLLQRGNRSRNSSQKILEPEAGAKRHLCHE